MAIAQSSIGQSADQYVREMFQDNADVLWVRSLSGAVNDLHPIKLTIGTDGANYRGLIQMDGFDQDLEIMGSPDGDYLALQEIDQYGHVTGYIKGILEHDRFTGQWWSSDVSRSADVRLLDDGLVFLKQFKPQLLLADGMAGDEALDWALYIESPYVVSGTWQRAGECVRMIGECRDFLCDQIEMVVSEGELKGSLVELRRNGSSYQVKTSVDGRPISGVATIRTEYPVHKSFLTSYELLVDYTCPVIRDGGFDLWIKDVLDDWMAGVVESSSDSIARNYNTRWLVSASAWVDIYLVEDELVSGLMTMYNVASSSYDRKAFTYSLAEGREFSIEEIARKGVDLLGDLQGRIETTRAQTDYRYPVLTESGFVMCTDFDPITGDATVCVPYDDVADSLRKRSMFNKLTD